MGHGYRRRKLQTRAIPRKTDGERLYEALMRLDRRFCERMLPYPLAATFTLFGIMVGILFQMGYGYLKILLGG